MESFSQYGHALLAMSLYGLLTVVLGAMTGIRKGAKNMAPGQAYEPDYDNPAYRLDRAYMNSVENLGAFAAITAAAVLAGASPVAVNIAASLILVLRLAYTFCYLGKVGAGYGGVRTILTVVSVVALVVMIIATLRAVF